MVRKYLDICIVMILPIFYLLIFINTYVNQPVLSNSNIKQEFRVILGKHWIHSHEEDKGDVKVYRPSTFNFPISRGRDGFEIMQNGTFIVYGIGKADTLDKTFHSYSLMNTNKGIILTIRLENNNMCMQINSYNNYKMDLKQWFVPKFNECT